MEAQQLEKGLTVPGGHQARQVRKEAVQLPIRAEHRFEFAVVRLDAPIRTQQGHGQGAVLEQRLIPSLGLTELVEASEEILVLRQQFIAPRFRQLKLLGDQSGLRTNKVWNRNDADEGALRIHQGHIVVEGIARARKCLLQQVQQGYGRGGGK